MEYGTHKTRNGLMVIKYPLCGHQKCDEYFGECCYEMENFEYVCCYDTDCDHVTELTCQQTAD